MTLIKNYNNFSINEKISDHRSCNIQTLKKFLTKKDVTYTTIDSIENDDYDVIIDDTGKNLTLIFASEKERDEIDIDLINEFSNVIDEYELLDNIESSGLFIYCIDILPE